VFGDKRPEGQPGDSGPEGSESAGSSSEPGKPASPAAEPAEPAGQAQGASSEAGESAGKRGSSAFRMVALGTAAVAALTAGIVYAVTQSGSTPSGASSAPRSAGAHSMRLMAMTPASQTTGVDGAAPVVVSFSAQLAPNTPKPRLSPSVAGSWSVAGSSLVFTPDTAFQPSTTVTVEVPGGHAGVRSADGALLAAPVTGRFTTGTYSQAALAELLAEQGYLPMTWSPIETGSTRAELVNADPAAQTLAGEAYDPPVGTFTWGAGYPAALQALWSPDQPNVLLKGAVMAFQSEHNMSIDGSLTPQLWQALFQAQSRGEQNANGYTYAIASKGSPETLTIWHNGQQVLESPANTGIGVAPTVDGTFPVFERFLHTIMSGTNPDGSHYSDPVSYVSYFNGGDAVHYFARPGYGWPQSLGCVELPYNAAQQAYPYLTYGSLVSVTG
jgi:Bacterial Ig-like domain/L,D-transpeptidase catalytic domain